MAAKKSKATKKATTKKTATKKRTGAIRRVSLNEPTLITNRSDFDQKMTAIVMFLASMLPRDRLDAFATMPTAFCVSCGQPDCANVEAYRQKLVSAGKRKKKPGRPVMDLEGVH